MVSGRSRFVLYSWVAWLAWLVARPVCPLQYCGGGLWRLLGIVGRFMGNKEEQIRAWLVFYLFIRFRQRVYCVFIHCPSSAYTHKWIARYPPIHRRRVYVAHGDLAGSLAIDGMGLLDWEEATVIIWCTCTCIYVLEGRRKERNWIEPCFFSTWFPGKSSRRFPY